MGEQILAKMAPLLLLVLLAGVASAAPVTAPRTCVTYFNFTATNQSYTWYGRAKQDGSITTIQNLGRRFDPQGRITVSPSEFAFTTLPDNVTTPPFGCCDPPAIQQVEMSTGKNTVTALHRMKSVTGSDCGANGCGFIEIGYQQGKLVGWVEQLLPPPPPTAEGAQKALAPVRQPPGFMGLSFVEFDATTGSASTIRPFYINNTAPQLMGSGMSTFEDEAFWFACSPDLSTNAVCRVSTSPGTTNPDIRMHVWSGKNNKKYSITSMKYSTALKAPVVLVQKLGDQTGTVSTRVMLAHQSGPWPMIIDLGQSWGGLHQATISPDGVHLIVNLSTGANQDDPTTELVTVDLVDKVEVSRIKVKNKNVFEGPAITVLEAFAC